VALALGRVLALVLVSALLLLSLLVLVFGLLGVIPGVLEVSSVTMRMWRSWVETEWYRRWGRCRCWCWHG